MNLMDHCVFSYVTRFIKSPCDLSDGQSFVKWKTESTPCQGVNQNNQRNTGKFEEKMETDLFTKKKSEL